MTKKVIDWCTSPLLSLMFRLLLGGIFVYAGVVKVTDPPGFAHALYNYHILPGWMVNPVAVILPWMELIVGACLLFGVWTQGGGLIAFGLLGIFACALGINLARGLDVACGCFSTSSSGDHVSWFYFVRDLVLLGMAGHVFFFDQRIGSLQRSLLDSRKQEHTVHENNQEESQHWSITNQI